MFNPVSTYRIQFNRDFTFKDLDAILPFLHKLGVKTIYASPIFAAVPGSTHGYDVINPFEINREIGTEAELYALREKLREVDMFWIQDIVPNHMAFHHGNLWLMDVLEKGSLSVYASFFDVTWSNELFHGRLMVPFLGASINEVIEKQELQIVYENDRLVFRYFDNYYPLHPRSYSTILSASGDIPLAVRQWVDQGELQHCIEEPVQYALAWRELMLQFSVLLKEPEAGWYIQERLLTINRDANLTTQIADQQVYRLCSWEETDHKINFRRFFTINGLICLNMQSQTVFDHYHKKIKKLIDDDVFQGLRVDHIDGLYNPLQYTERLRKLAGPETYIVVEKILEPEEKMPTRWPIEGTTGYDFLALVNNLFTKNNAEGKFSKLYNSFQFDKRSVREKIEEKKAMILSAHMGGELENLYHLLLELNLFKLDSSEQFTADEIKDGIATFLIVCPVYRYYGNEFPLGNDEQRALQKMLKSCKRKNPERENFFDLLEQIFIDNTNQFNDEYNQRAIQFYQRCMQFTGPLMAKGVEDTLMYSFNRFIGHNEVGDSPEFFGLTTQEFHKHMTERQSNWPLTLNTTATHDTKRGEGVRSRLNVLPAVVDEWTKMVQHWRELNQPLITEGIPDANDEYFIYQTLVGTFPLAENEMDDYRVRLSEYFTKALRESKQHSGWASPNTHYEEKAINFVNKILESKSPFRKSFDEFQKKVSDFGMINSLAQVLLKLTCPGVPDLYQGTTAWDFSLVDPDNRRAVDFDLRSRNLDSLMKDIRQDEALVKELWQTRSDARIKLWLVHRLLMVRNQDKELFRDGLYVPLQTGGKYNDNIIAFARCYGKTWYVVVAPLYLAKLCNDQKRSVEEIDWSDTYIEMPDHAPVSYETVFDNRKATHTHKIFIRDIFVSLPFALLKLTHQKRERRAGVLLPIASLPSTFGIGDVGGEAKKFAMALARSGQQVWQILPLNPVASTSAYSPYSSHSAMAIHPFYISLEYLVNEGLLDNDELKKLTLISSDKINYAKAETLKSQCLDNAWVRFRKRNAVTREYEQFIANETSWLDDFALYESLKRHFSGAPWYSWPEKYKNRDAEALADFRHVNEDEVLKIKWIQFVAWYQWTKLRRHCNACGVNILGDLPFYVSHDSADVWSHREIFSLGEDGSIQGVAGVPPDYFDSNGQLWGMPVFRWDVLKANQYNWWIKRIKRNMALFDILRFDHFRAFINFWEVPSGEATAVNGTWRDGPGKDFFEALKSEFPDMPFVAEDLGDINPAVFRIRDDYNLPGMKILQFAFDAAMADSIYIPHQYTSNFIVYTGTHDNNTTRGWYKNDLTKEDQQRLSLYLSKKISERNVSDELIRLAYSSIAKIVIIPLQDVLGLDDRSRMNKPSTEKNNWLWKLKYSQFTTKHEQKLLRWIQTYGR